MVTKRLRWFLESQGLLHMAQSGFRQDRSTLDDILRLHDFSVQILYRQKVSFGSVPGFSERL